MKSKKIKFAQSRLSLEQVDFEQQKNIWSVGTTQDSSDIYNHNICNIDYIIQNQNHNILSETD